MASLTPTSSPIHEEQHNPHPYPIKTSHTGLLTRSNSSKAHGSWSRHHYTPTRPSPSAFVFDLPESSPDAARRQAPSSPRVRELHASPSSHKSYQNENPRGSERSGSMSPSPSKYSRSWVGRNSDGEQVNLPRHPYLWNPAQLATYLSSELYGSDGEPLDSDVVKPMVDFIKERKIGGRAFLNLDQEDFQEMEGVDSLWSNTFWDASSALRQRLTPYRTSRISSSSYKHGRVRGVVDLFERSASDTSDVGEDEAQNRSSGKLTFTNLPPTRKRPRKTPTHPRVISVSEEQSSGNLEASLPMEPIMEAGSPTVHNVVSETEPRTPSSVNVGLDINENPTHPPLSSFAVEDNLAVVIPPQFGSPVNLVLGLDEFQHRAADSPEPNLPDDSTLNHNKEVKIISSHPQKISELSMAELYEQTYGALPSSRIRQPVSRDPSDNEEPGETLKVVAAATSASDPPPTALRPVVQRRAASPPRSLRQLFVPSSVLQAASDLEPQSIYVLPASGSERDETAARTLGALKERLAIVERRLEAMEMQEAKEKISEDAVPRSSIGSRRTPLPVENEMDDLDLEVRSYRSSEAIRSWQSAYILLAGATTGISVVLIPMLLRHLWSR